MKQAGIRGTHVAITAGSLVLVSIGALFAAAAYLSLTSRDSDAPVLKRLGVVSPKEAPVILFLGDLMFDRHIRRMARAYGEDHILSCVTPLLERADLVVGNLEGPITEEASVSEGTVPGSMNNFRFTFPPSTASLLEKHGIRLVNLGNNHIGDFGVAGMHSTRAYLDIAGVAHFGGLTGDEPVYRTELKGVPLSFVSYNQFGGGTPESVAEAIASERTLGRTVIVYTHWGEEYVEPTVRMRETALLFAKSGATLVIGSHPHVVQSSERIGDTLVYYSLGNFVFDQYWDAEVSTGLAVLVRLEAEGPVAEELPVRMNRTGRTCPL